MASSDQIKALIKSYAEGDSNKFYTLAMQVAASEAKKGHEKLAQEIRKIIDDAKKRGEISQLAKDPIPIVRPRGDLSELLSVLYPKTRLSDLILNQQLSQQLEKIVKEQRNINKLRSYDLSPIHKILLVGPPGCGKTMTASCLAGELGIPLFVVRLDGLITKYMGETIVKLRKIFDEFYNIRAVYLFDEFDSIGTQRDFINDVGEIRRVLNSFLMFIEEDKSNSLILAATNHPQQLDYALFRRFDQLLEYSLPDKDLIIKLMKTRLSLYDNKEIDFESLADISLSLSFDEIVRACEEAIKEMIIEDRDTLTTDNLTKSLSGKVMLQQKYKHKL